MVGSDSVEETKGRACGVYVCWGFRGTKGRMKDK